MRLKNIFLILLIFIASVSCSKEETLIATNSEESGGLVFPEKTKFDDITNAIFDKFGTKIYWGEQISSTDVNKAWTSSLGTYNFNYLNEEQAGNTIHFLNDYIFTKIDPVLFNKALKTNIYLLYDLNTLIFGALYAPIIQNTNGMDNWLLSFYGKGLDKYPQYGEDEQHQIPTTDEDIFKFRRELFISLLDNLYMQGIIEAPDVFSTDFSYNALKFKYELGDADDALFFMNHGFCGNVNYSSGTLSPLHDQSSSGVKNNFLSYVAMVYTYSKSDIEAGAGINDVPFKKFPRVLELYDLVDNYFIQNYHYDLKQLHTL